MGNNLPNESRRIKGLDTGELKREERRRYHSWHAPLTDGGREINTYVYRLIVNELHARSAF